MMLVLSVTCEYKYPKNILTGMLVSAMAARDMSYLSWVGRGKQIRVVTAEGSGEDWTGGYSGEKSRASRGDGGGRGCEMHWKPHVEG